MQNWENSAGRPEFSENVGLRLLFSEMLRQVGEFTKMPAVEQARRDNPGQLGVGHCPEVGLASSAGRQIGLTPVDLSRTARAPLPIPPPLFYGPEPLFGAAS